jgi:hypothetical protein
VAIFTYDTYQDVRGNIVKYAGTIFLLVGIVFRYALPPSLAWSLSELFVAPVPKWIADYMAVPAVVTAVALALFEIFKVHDDVYDKYVIRWRFRYATDLILPRLLRPFAHKLSRPFLEKVEEDPGVFEDALFYPFVGDRDLKIRKNLLVRFYEQVTPYWFSQVNELAVIAVVLGAAIFWMVGGSGDPAFLNRLLRVLFLAALAFALNRLWIRALRERLRRATADEIDEILARYRGDLEAAVRRVCAEYGFPYGTDV